MINLSRLNKLVFLVFFFTVVINNISFSEEGEGSVDIWKKQEKKQEQNSTIDNEEEITIESPILSTDENTIKNIDELQLDKTEQIIVGLFDPEENNFNLNMWLESDGEDIKKNNKKN